jgi:succinate dehydrogenase/fumarate reductase flavoprotein subunit
MAYTKELKGLIKKVEKTRAERIKLAKKGEHYGLMEDKEKNEVLHKFHPDYIKEAKRKLGFGPNKGDTVPNEIAGILESRSRIAPKDISLDEVDYDTDVLVIGGGGAGACAAVVAHQNGAKVILATKLRLGDSNTMMAEGGIQAADKKGDSPAIHFLDTIGGGHFDNDRELLEVLVKKAPQTLRWLESMGVMFDKSENGSIKVLHGGGTSRKRMHSAGDMTGAAIMRTLRDEVGNLDIEVIEFSPAVELLLDSKGRCAGAVLYNLETGEYYVARAKSVVLATGGFGRLHLMGFPTTNHYGATADGIIMAYRAGCSLAFMDASQFHPTGAIYPEQNVGLLITEKMRGAGAQVLNAYGEQFVYPLEPRDVESATVIRECKQRGKGVKTPTGRDGVWLDTPMIDILKGEGYIEKNFPAKYRQFMRHGIDISKEPVLVYPTLHYQNGGIKIKPDTETEVRNLFACGEVAGGIHGRNRLMGNSLLDITVFGIISGEQAAKNASGKSPRELSLKHVQKYDSKLDTQKISPVLLPDYRFKVG